MEGFHHAGPVVVREETAMEVIAFATCPYCDGHGQDCGECQGTGAIALSVELPIDALDKELEALQAELYHAWLREYEG